jgi:hypothetical protein
MNSRRVRNPAGIRPQSCCRPVIRGSMTIGNFTAFNSYLSILNFPVIILDFMKNVMARANASYGHFPGVLNLTAGSSMNSRKRCAIPFASICRIVIY